MTPDMPPDAGRSWWLREALAADPGEPCPPLSGTTTADVLILGGGYTGMWTAWFLKEREPGIDVVILEQDICGGGPSGRNGGFVNGWASALDELVEMFGDDGARRLLEASLRAVDEIGAWCEANGIDAWFTRRGDLGVSASPAQDGAWRGILDEAERLGFGADYEELTADEVRSRCDSPVFRGGFFVPRAATVQPALLARGLRRMLLERGVRIFEGSAVRRFRPGPPAEAETGAGLVRAGSAVIALNAWAQYLRPFGSRLMSRASSIVLTAPGPERLAELGWTGGEAIWDERSAVHYLRTTPNGRIAFGVGGLRTPSPWRIGRAFAYDERSIRIAAADFRRMFPSFADVPLEAAWGGPIDICANDLPFFGTLPSGNVHYGLGYTGNGVGPSHLGGRIIASLVRGIEDDDTRLPIVHAEPEAFPPEPIRSLGAAVVMEAIRHKDETEDRGRRPNPLIAAVARLPRRLGYRLGP